MSIQLKVVYEKDCDVFFVNETIVRHIKLVDMTLFAEDVTTTYRVGVNKKTGKQEFKQKVDSSSETLSFPLTQITPLKVEELRFNNSPSFILKQNGKYFYTPIPLEKRISFYDAKVIGEHKCAFGNKMCAHLCALPDEQGGCEKVRLKGAKLEDFKWITEGYETFGIFDENFVVLKCSHYENFFNED